MAPRRFVKVQYHQQPSYQQQTWFPTQSNSSHSQNFGRNFGWPDSRMINNNYLHNNNNNNNNSGWSNGSQMPPHGLNQGFNDHFFNEERRDFNFNNEYFSPDKMWEQARNIVRGRGRGFHNKFNRGSPYTRPFKKNGGRGFKNNRGGNSNNNMSNRRFEEPSIHIPSDPYFSPKFENRNVNFAESFGRDQENSNNFYEDDFDTNNFENEFRDVENARDGKYAEISFFNENNTKDTNFSSNNWVSFENQNEVRFQGAPKRGRGRGRGSKRLNNNSIRQRVNINSFKKNAKNTLKKSVLKKKLLNMKKSNRGRKKVFKSKFGFDRILADFEMGFNKTKSKVNDCLPEFINDEFIIIDQTVNDSGNEILEKEIVMSSDGDSKDTEDLNDEPLVTESTTDKNEVKEETKNESDQVIPRKETLPMFCEMCNVYCLTEKNFETHNQSNNHCIKMSSLKTEVNAIEKTEVKSPQKENLMNDKIEVVETGDNVNMESNAICDVKVDDDILEVDNMDATTKSKKYNNWNPDQIYGRNFMVQFTGYFCKVCKKYFNSIQRASNHCRSLVHFEKCKVLQNLELKEEVDE